MTKEEQKILRDLNYHLLSDLTSINRYIDYMHGDGFVKKTKERTKEYLELAFNAKNDMLFRLNEDPTFKDMLTCLTDEHIEELKHKIHAICKDMEFYENPGPIDPKYIPKKAENK